MIVPSIAIAGYLIIGGVFAALGYVALTAKVDESDHETRRALAEARQNVHHFGLMLMLVVVVLFWPYAVAVGTNKRGGR